MSSYEQDGNDLNQELEREVDKASRISPHLTKASLKGVLEIAKGRLTDLLGPLKTPIEIIDAAIGAYREAKENAKRLAYETKVRFVTIHTRSSAYNVPTALRPVLDELAGIEPQGNVQPLPEELERALQPIEQTTERLDRRIAEMERQRDDPLLNDADVNIVRQQILAGETAFLTRAETAMDTEVEHPATLEHVSSDTRRDVTAVVLDDTVDPLDSDEREHIDETLRDIEEKRLNDRYSALNSEKRFLDYLQKISEQSLCDWVPSTVDDIPVTMQADPVEVQLPNGGLVHMENLSFNELGGVKSGRITLNVPLIEDGEETNRTIVITANKLGQVFTYFDGKSVAQYDNDPNTLAFADALFEIAKQIPEAVARHDKGLPVQRADMISVDASLD